MNTSELTNVCRICPNSGGGETLFVNIFDELLALTYNLKEVILVTTGVEILKNDLISTKICQKCCNVTLKMFRFRQEALEQDQALKEMLNHCLDEKGLKLPKTSITIRKDKGNSNPLIVPNSSPSTSKDTVKKTLHPSIADLYKTYPGIKIATKCFEKDMSPFVSLPMDDVEGYFKNKRLDMRKFIYRSRPKPNKPQPFNAVAKKKTACPARPRTVEPLKISLKLFGNKQHSDRLPNNYVCGPLSKKRGRKPKIHSPENDQCPKSEVINKNIIEPVSLSVSAAMSVTNIPKQGITTHTTSSTSPISIKRFGNKEQPDCVPNSDVCTPLPKKRGRKRKIPLPENDRCPSSEVIKKNIIEPVSVSPTMSATNTSKQAIITYASNSTLPTIEPADVHIEYVNIEPVDVNIEPVDVNIEPADVNIEPADVNIEPVDVNIDPADVNIEPADVNIEHADVNIPHPILAVTIPQIDAASIEKSSDTTSYIPETALTSNSSSKPDIIEALGLMPRIYTIKSQKLLNCNVCGSVHNSGIELKWHYRKHMVCQFCKRKCKSIDAKQNHVDKFCKIKRIMNSPGPSVDLERIHLNLDVRKKHIEAFSTFDPIPGLIEPAPLEHVVLEAASPPPVVFDDGIIVLSDDDESLAGPSDPLSFISIPLTAMPPPGVQRAMYNSVNQIRPDIKIKNNMVFSHLSSRTSDKDIIKDIIKIIKPAQPTTCDEMLQTSLPNRDIKIRPEHGTCEFKDLKEQLMFYKVPIKVSNGNFKVFYDTTVESSLNKNMEFWDDLPVIEHYERRVPEPINTTSAINSLPHQYEIITDSHVNENISVSSAQVDSIPEISFSAPVTLPTTATVTNTSCDSAVVSRPNLNGIPKTLPVAAKASQLNSLVSPSTSITIPTTKKPKQKTLKPNNTSKVYTSGGHQNIKNTTFRPSLPSLNEITKKTTVADFTVNSISLASSSAAPNIHLTATQSSTSCDSLRNQKRSKLVSRVNVPYINNTPSTGGPAVTSALINSSSIASSYSPSTTTTATEMSAKLPSFPTTTSTANNLRSLTNTVVNSSSSVANNAVTRVTSNSVLSSIGGTPLLENNAVTKSHPVVVNKSVSIPKPLRTIIISEVDPNRSSLVKKSNPRSPTSTDTNNGPGSSNANIPNIYPSVAGSCIVKSNTYASVIQPPLNTPVMTESFSTTNSSSVVPSSATQMPPSISTFNNSTPKGRPNPSPCGVQSPRNTSVINGPSTTNSSSVIPPSATKIPPSTNTSNPTPNIRSDPSASGIQPPPNTSVINGSFSTTNTNSGCVPPAATHPLCAKSPPKEPVKFRVKKVWELQ